MSNQAVDDKKAVAIATDKQVTLAAQLNEFCAKQDLTAEQSKAVREDTTKLLQAATVMVRAMVEFGKTLTHLHAQLGPQKFDAFCTEFGKRYFGKSRSALYRYRGAYIEAARMFGPATESVLRLTDGGQGLVAVSFKEGEATKAVISPTAKIAYDKMPKLPADATPEAIEKWSLGLVSQIGKESKNPQKSNATDVINKLIDSWQDFAMANEKRPSITKRIRNLKEPVDRHKCLEHLKDVLTEVGRVVEEIESTINAIPAVQTEKAAEAASKPRTKRTKAAPVAVAAA